MSAPFIVTMDGPAGVGKSTLAKQVAAALGVAYLDTGAMFRTVALAVFICQLISISVCTRTGSGSGLETAMSTHISLSA